MRDLLLNRFRGALLGAVLGDAVGSVPSRLTWAEVQSRSTLSPWRDRLADSLPSLLLPIAQQQLANSPVPPAATALPLAILPTALFWHDSPVQLRQQILHLTSGQSDRVQAATLLFGEAIATALREELLPRQLLPQLSEQVAPLSLEMAEQLTQVQTWLDRASLAQVQRQIASIDPLLAEVAMAFYCWLSTPDDFNLALLRSCGRASALVGALAGATGGVRSIAIDWWLPLAESPHDNLNTIDRLAEQLLAAWAGAYHPDRLAPITAAAIAAAGSIRPR